MRSDLEWGQSFTSHYRAALTPSPPIHSMLFEQHTESQFSDRHPHGFFEGGQAVADFGDGVLDVKKVSPISPRSVKAKNLS